MHTAFFLTLLQSTTFAAPPPAVAQQATLVGRFVPEAAGLHFAWPNSAIGGRFWGTELQVRLRRAGAPAAATQADWFEVRLDDGPPRAFALTPGQEVFRLADGLPPGVHTVWLRKRTEALVGSSLFSGFDPGPRGHLLPPPAMRPRRLLFVGASNETGFGNLVSLLPPDSCGFSPATEDALQAYPQRVADRLGAEVENIAYAGRGLLHNDPGLGAATAPRLPELFEAALPQVAPGTAALPQPSPDAIVVDVGGNDFSGGTPPRRPFVRAYTAFLLRLRARHPQVPLVAVLGPMQQGAQRAAMRAYVQEAVAAVGEARTTYFEFDAYVGPTFGCLGHPDRALHLTMAEQLAPYLARRLAPRSLADGR